MKEPSVLDYLKSKLFPWRGEKISLPDSDIPVEGVPGDDPSILTAAATAQTLERAAEGQVSDFPSETPGPALSPAPERTPRRWPWRSLAALCFALAAQLAFEPPQRSTTQGILMYGLALAALGWSVWREEWTLAAHRPDETWRQDPLTVRRTEFWIGAALAVLAFAALGGNLFTSLNLLLWLLALGFIVAAFWLPPENPIGAIQRFFGWLRRENWTVKITRWGLLVLFVLGVAAFYRFYRLPNVPPEMVSDHAEKLLDVYDVMHGMPHIFFPRNTGREFFQMYLTATMILIFKTGFSFTSLKLGTTLAGFFTLPFIYLLGKEVYNRRVGLLAMLFAGIAYWPNVIARIALRFTLYPFFAAPTLFFLVRGLRRRSRNDFILSGFFLGLGLNGYSPMRVVPILVVIAVVIYLLHRQSLGNRRQAVYGLILLALVSFMIFLPLFRYMLDNPEAVSYRALTRMGSLERPLPGSPVVIFFQNLWKSLIMFAWDNGNIWVHSVAGRPALSVVAAALFHLGAVLTFIRYLRQRHWVDIFLLLSIPVLMLPSILSLAFPDENPSLNRSGAALIPVFILVGLALDGLMGAMERQMRRPWGNRAAWSLVLILALWSGMQDYDLVFNQYARVFAQSSWNTSEMGQVLKDFTTSIGDVDHAWVVAYPYWVDTRLVGINAGYPTRDTAISPDQIPQTNTDNQTKLFMLNPADQEGLAALRSVYPQGTLTQYPTSLEGKEFYIYLVPGAPLSDQESRYENFLVSH
jgi:4-amino-4-deoxy-L-arabinose transferase-like glycosyltransferase